MRFLAIKVELKILLALYPTPLSLLLLHPMQEKARKEGEFN